MSNALRTALPPTDAEERVTLIDALRGSAIVGLCVVHCAAHFELALYPEHSPAWLSGLDGLTNRVVFFFFGGKAFGIFALLFGVSFALLLDRWSRRGINVVTRFSWRLLLLAALGYLNGVVYNADMLLVLAILGLPLVALSRLSDRALAALAVPLLLLLPSAWLALRAALDPALVLTEPRHWAISEHLRAVYAGGSLGEVVAANLGPGQLARLWYTYESGRYLTVPGLFICGLLLGRRGVLEDFSRARILARGLVGAGVLGFLVLQAVRETVPTWGLGGLRLYYVAGPLDSYRNLTLLAIWVGGFILLYLRTGWRRVLDCLAPFGRMSLSCYVAQGLFFVPFFFGFGLGMYRRLGQSASVLAGLAFLVLQGACAHWWLRRFHYGPLEWLWRAGTIRSLRTPFRRHVPDAGV